MGATASKPGDDRPHFTSTERLKREKRPASLPTGKLKAKQKSDKRNSLPGVAKVTNSPKTHRLTISQQSRKAEATVQYFAIVDRIVDIWPKYQMFRLIDLQDVSIEVLDNVIMALTQLVEQHDLIQRLSHEDVEEYAGSKLNRLTQAAARGHARNNSDDLNLPNVTIRRGSSPDQNRKNRSLSSEPDGARQQLLAELDKLRRTTLKKSPSSNELMASYEGNQSPKMQRREEYKRIEDLKAEVKCLREQLEICRQNHTSQLPESPIIARNLSTKHDNNKWYTEFRLTQVNKVKEEYAKLEKFMMCDVKTELDHIQRYVDDRMKFSFLCSVVEEAFSICISYKKIMKENVLQCCENPLMKNPEAVGRNRTTSIDPRQTVLQNISIFESRSNPESPNLQLNVDEKKKQMMLQLQEDAVQIAGIHADKTNLSEAVQVLLLSLKENFPRLMNETFEISSVANKYIKDCLGLAWEATVLDPPMAISTDCEMPFSDQLHLPFRSQKIKGAAIDYYLWPILYERLTGPVVGKGRVAFRIIR